jgi:hypothetical protein
MAIRILSCALAAFTLANCGAREPQVRVVPAGTAGVRCVNLSSGTAWAIPLDHARKLADGQPARMDSGQVDWRDPSDAGLYHLDLVSGALTVTRASSTGGYISVFRCTAIAPPPAAGPG